MLVGVGLNKAAGGIASGSSPTFANLTIGGTITATSAMVLTMGGSVSIVSNPNQLTITAPGAVSIGPGGPTNIQGTLGVTNFTDGSGTTGNQTLNVPRGICAIAAAGSSCIITNSAVLSSTSLVIPVLQTVDSTAKSVVAVCSAGSVTFTLNAAATGTVKIGFLVISS